MKKAQSLLDFVLIFGILIAVTVGFTRIWVWFNTNLAKRSVDYQNTRLSAGSANDSHETTLAYTDAQLPLDDDWIFRGKTNETIGPPLPGTNLGIIPVGGGNNSAAALAAACASAQAAATSMRVQAVDMDKQAQKLEDVAGLGDHWYDPFFSIFKILGIDVDDLKNSAQKLRQGATDTRTQATSLENQICNAVPPDPYEGPQPWEQKEEE